MEHPCNQCGATVEDGTPFCRHCHAPQIRVVGFETLPVPNAGHAQEGPQETAAWPTPILRPTVINWSSGFRVAAAAGLIAAVLMFTPVGGLGLGMLAGGFLAVALYRRKNLGSPLPTAAAAKLGLLTGGTGFAFFALLLAAQITFFHKGPELRAALVHAVEQAASHNADPQAQAVANWLKSPDGLSLMIILSLFFTLIVFLILGAVGGALGTVILRNKPKS